MINSVKKSVAVWSFNEPYVNSFTAYSGSQELEREKIKLCWYERFSHYQQIHIAYYYYILYILLSDNRTIVCKISSREYPR